VSAIQGAPSTQAPAGDDAAGDPGSTALAAQDAPEARLLRTFAFDGRSARANWR
jgi:hypothetical protein